VGFFLKLSSSFVYETCSAQRFFTALRAVGIALGASNDIDDDAAAVFAARRAGAVILTKLAALARNETSSGESVVAPAFTYF
jgi:hypothetical protein